MRVWYQSDASIGFDSSWDNYEQCLRKHIGEVKLPNTVVDIYGIDHKKSKIEEQYKKSKNYKIISNALEAQKRSYDVFVVGCTLDPAWSEIRRMVGIPSAFIGESSMYYSRALGRKVSIVTRTKEVCVKMRKNVKRYGCQRHISEIKHLSLTLGQLARGFNNPKPVIDEFRDKSRELKRNGVEVIIPGCGILNMILVENGIKRVDHVIIVDTAAVLIKTAELFGNLRKR